jgi:hypothetical protein
MGYATHSIDKFYETWRLAVQLYGIYNPYTHRGAIKGLLTHGPHSISDVIATHVLKQTGSYALAAFEILASPETVMQHYGRFLPRKKIARAAKILNAQTPKREIFLPRHSNTIHRESHGLGIEVRKD